MSQHQFKQNKMSNNQILYVSSTQAYSTPNSQFPPAIKPTQNNQSQTIQRILSSSIQRAKQKINKIQGHSRQKDSGLERSFSREHITSPNNNAIAGAMKILQTKVIQLQKSIEDISREKSIILEELQNVNSQKKILFNNLNQVNLKSSQQDMTITNYKIQIKEANKKLDEALNQAMKYQGKSKELQMIVKHLQEDKQHLMTTVKRKQDEINTKRQNSAQENIMKRQQLQEKIKQINDKQKKIQEKQRRLVLVENSLKEKQARISQDVQNVQSQISKYKQMTRQNSSLRLQMEQIKSQTSKLTDSIKSQSKESYEFYLKKIDEMQLQIQMLRQTTKTMSMEEEMREKENNDELLDELNDMRNKYDQLLHMYKRSQDKLKREEKDMKAMKERSREVQDILCQILDKISKLTNCPKQLKYLTIRANKYISSKIQKVTTLQTPTKNRSSSMNRSLSRSNSVRKTTNQSMLNNSRNSQKSISSKSKKKQKVQSGSKSKRSVQQGSKGKRFVEQTGQKVKKVVVSLTGLQLRERELNELKKQYKKLVRVLNETEDQQLRSKLNNLAFEIQQKSETITKLKQSLK